MTEANGFEHLTLAEQVAQLFMVGYEGLTPNPITHRFLERGVGGLIFFRDNFDALPQQTPQAVADLTEKLQASVPAHLPHMLMGIDQEGGQVERLPHTLFPTALSPRAVALAPAAEPLAQSMYQSIAQHLRALGLNLNFFPTLDVNLQAENPIIGVRSFGDDPETVWRFADIALRAFAAEKLIAVGKHFPGHGNGTVDSHLDLPTLHFSEVELQPFQQAIEAGVPVMLVAHGYYPALQTTEAERQLPSSASPAVIQGLLRERCGFQGVIITDDMCMGAITKHRNPVEAALASLKAGVDILLYKQSTEAEWAVYEAVLAAFESGVLPLSQLQDSLHRIARLKAHYLAEVRTSPITLTPTDCAQQARNWAEQGISLLAGSADALPLPLEAPLLLVHPERTGMGNYAFDVPTSPSLEYYLEKAGFNHLEGLTYPAKQAFEAQALCDGLTTSAPETVLFVSFNPLIYTSQANLYTLLKARFPQARFILASAGTPYDLQALAAPEAHLSLCTYRPANMQALANLLANGFSTKATPDALQPAKPLPAKPL
ncbi:glycoside hydrolase family 3 N-terminal domain-containing protein [Vampirovibrio chlorellavorus]|uniref:glycoside hydrolase family 3 N-terminal domain-containing protein n=1 Tax=Vampirovibrio chlorellavorus TaxID=758823 RepID=UPI0026EEB793|nr:glycoside hydrolase family 3 N-terminal domain-containing protein [Vampirovibrio chlorellavorus]